MTAAITTTTDQQQRAALVGATADEYARAGVFADYADRRAANTLRRQKANLALFAKYLTAAQFYTSDDGRAELL
jgi:hypothetical protein